MMNGLRLPGKEINAARAAPKSLVEQSRRLGQVADLGMKGSRSRLGRKIKATQIDVL
jgi:hypothetical protein